MKTRSIFPLFRTTLLVLLASICGMLSLQAIHYAEPVHETDHDIYAKEFVNLVKVYNNNNKTFITRSFPDPADLSRRQRIKFVYLQNYADELNKVSLSIYHEFAFRRKNQILFKKNLTLEDIFEFREMVMDTISVREQLVADFALDSLR